jgi:hypothetical protein
MKSDLTDITLVMDRSGSMVAIREDAEGGVNSFIKEQARTPGEAVLTLVQFDTEYEFVHKGIPIQQASEYKLVPRGMTALLDAIGRAINETGARLEKMEERDRPGLVIFVVMTDGQENSSREFTRAQIREMIERQQSRFQWHFTFLGANQDAFTEAGGMGIHAAGIANFANAKFAQAYGCTSSKIDRMRSQRRAGQEVCNEFTDEERQRMS